MGRASQWGHRPWGCNLPPSHEIGPRPWGTGADPGRGGLLAGKPPTGSVHAVSQAGVATHMGPRLVWMISALTAYREPVMSLEVLQLN